MFLWERVIRLIKITKMQLQIKWCLWVSSLENALLPETSRVRVKEWEAIE